MPKDRPSRSYRAVATEIAEDGVKTEPGDRDFVSRHPLDAAGIQKEGRKAAALAMKMGLNSIAGRYQNIDISKPKWYAPVQQAAEVDQVYVTKLKRQRKFDNRLHQLWEILHVITFAITEIADADWRKEKGLE